MNKYWKITFSYTFAVTSAIFSFIPVKFFSDVYCWNVLPEYWNVAINRLIFLLCVGIFTRIIVFLWYYFRKKFTISGHNYKIEIKYGDLFEQKKYKKVIGFDECYTTEIGDAVGQIKQNLLCGQFLQNHEVYITSLLSINNLIPAETPSEYNNKQRYESGSLLPYGDYLLMAFGKLNTEGRAVMSREEYLSCLNKLWKEINNIMHKLMLQFPCLEQGLLILKEIIFPNNNW